jgi:5-methylthioadenosine/S-adenosylhomocysteine deaminase
MTATLLEAPFVLTMDADNRVIENGAVLVEGTRISAVGDAAALARAHPGATRERFPRALLMPGLINTHMHSGLLRGTAEGLPLWDWLRLYIDPMHRVLQPREAEVASWLCYAESLLAGTTTVVDMWRFMQGSARAAARLGNRVIMVPYVGEHPEFDYFDRLDDNEALIESCHGSADGRVMAWVGLEHAFYFTEEATRRAIDIALRHRTGLHTHSNETRAEVDEMHRRHALRPIHALERFGLLEPDTVLLAHGVWLDDSEIETLARRGVGIAHNPSSNMKLASGAAPVDKLLAAGVAVGLGSDGEKENNNLDLFEEMKVASLLAKFQRMDAAALPSWDIVRMATIGGARAIGMADRLGSLEAGKLADIVAVRTDTPRMTPMMGGEHFNLHHNLVHAVQGGDVVMTMCHGSIVARDGRLLSADMDELIAQAHDVVPGLFARRAAWLARNRQGAVSPV